MPPYLRDVLHKSSQSYVRTPACYLQLVEQLLAENPHEVLFLVLNYDTLLERAITMLRPAYVYGAAGDYVRQDRQAKVVKMHGSFNWFRDIGPSSPRDLERSSR